MYFQSMRHLLYFLAFYSIAIEIHAQIASLINFKLEMQGKVIRLVEVMKEAFANRCSRDVYECTVKSIPACWGTSQKRCDLDFPDFCSREGADVSETSGIWFPASQDLNNISEANRQFVCLTATMEDEFKKLDEGRRKRYSLGYVASWMGSHRQYPSDSVLEENDRCADYDPRSRPWYVSATTGPKNIVIVIDVSGSMDLTKLRPAKTAVKSIINSLSNVDFVGVVAFNQTATKLYSNRIERAQNVVKAQLMIEVSNLNAGGTTNYAEAFTEALSMLKQAAADEYGAPCSNAENVILFLTDGLPSDSNLTAQSTIQLINREWSGERLKIFTYGMGSNSDTKYEFLKKISCAFHGIMFKINPSTPSELVSIMEGYYQYLSLGANISSPVWGEPYEDYSGFGTLYTVSMPIYYEQNNFRRVIGVAGLDIKEQTMLDFGVSREEIGTYLISSSNNCPGESLSECQLEYFRPDDAKCQNQVCAEDFDFNRCQNPQTTDIFIRGTEFSKGYCCPLDVVDPKKPSQQLRTIYIIIITAVISIFVASMIMGICCYCRNAKRRENKSKYTGKNDARIWHSDENSQQIKFGSPVHYSQPPLY